MSGFKRWNYIGDYDGKTEDALWISYLINLDIMNKFGPKIIDKSYI